jgi:hypothetical protein
MAVAALVALVWINQGVADRPQGPGDRAVVTSVTPALQAIRAPLVILYRRGTDVRLYYELANLMLGRPSDPDFVVRQRGYVPARLSRVSFPPADGRWHAPYAEVPLEYPVLAVPFLLAPRLLASGLDAYGFVFGALMGLCLIGAGLAALDAAREAGVDADGLRQRAWLLSGLLLAQGTVAVQRLDAVAALWIALAMRAAVRRRPIELGVWAALATATKILPVFLLPVQLAADARFWGPRALRRLGVAFTVTVMAGFLPMFVFSGHALADVIRYHSLRGLQCESTLGILLAGAHCITGNVAPAVLSFGSDNLQGHAADRLAALCGPLSVGGSLGMAWVVGRSSWRDGAAGGQGPARVASATFATLVVLWLSGKVFSPQFLTWGIPVVLAIPGLLGIRIAWLFVGVAALTQLYLCGHYELVRDGNALGLLNVAARQALLAATGYLAARGLVTRGEAARPEVERAWARADGHS